MKAGSGEIQASFLKLDELKEQFNRSLSNMSSRLKDEILSARGPSWVELEKLLLKKANLEDLLGL